MRSNGWKGKYKEKKIMTKEESRQKAAKEEEERASKGRGKKDPWRKGALCTSVTDGKPLLATSPVPIPVAAACSFFLWCRCAG